MSNKLKTDNIKRYMDLVSALAQTDENKKRKAKWGSMQRTSRDLWRATPKMDGSCQHGEVPIIAGMSNVFWHDYYNFSIKDYMLNPEIFLENFLRLTAERFTLFDDDFFIDMQIPIRMATVYEASIFGMKWIYEEHNDPHIDYTPVIKNYDDLYKIPELDFNTTGLMPEARRLYDTVSELASEDFYVHFPEWIRGPFGIAVYLRGFNNLLMDIYDNPGFVHELMKYICDVQKKWFRAREKYTGRKQGKINLFNDSVNIPIISRDIYNEFIFPYEKDLHDHFSGIYYWHSCGCIDDIYKDIDKIGDIELIHCSAWSSNIEAAKVFKDKAPIDVCLNTEQDVIRKSDDEIFKSILKISTEMNACGAKGYSINLEAIDTVDSVGNSIELIRRYIYQARKATEFACK